MYWELNENKDKVRPTLTSDLKVRPTILRPTECKPGHINGSYFIVRPTMMGTICKIRPALST